MDWVMDADSTFVRQPLIISNPFADLTETGLTGPLVSAWGSLYNIVQQTNKIINGNQR